MSKNEVPLRDRAESACIDFVKLFMDRVADGSQTVITVEAVLNQGGVRHLKVVEKKEEKH